jgi:hypothetical protein
MHSAARMASAISATSRTRNPVRPFSTISDKAPRGKATTGVPQASASIATSELVSSARLGTTTQRAADSNRLLRAKPMGPMKRRMASRRVCTSA